MLRCAYGCIRVDKYDIMEGEINSGRSFMTQKWQKFISLVKSNYEFNIWNRLKQKLEINKYVPHIKEGQIWWSSLGKNLGVEMNGKNAPFSRPVLIFRKLNRWSFLAVPLTSQKKTGPWYVGYKFKNKMRYANLGQIRVISVFRLSNQMGQVSDKVMKRICCGLYDLYIRDRYEK